MSFQIDAFAEEDAQNFIPTSSHTESSRVLILNDVRALESTSFSADQLKLLVIDEYGQTRTQAPLYMHASSIRQPSRHRGANLRNDCNTSCVHIDSAGSGARTPSQPISGRSGSQSLLRCGADDRSELCPPKFQARIDNAIKAAASPTNTF